MRAAHRAFVLVMCLAFFAAGGYAVTNQSVQTDVSVMVASTFKLQIYQPDGTHVLYSDTVPFTNINPAKSFALPDGRAENDGKSDVGVYCISADNKPWSLRIGVTGGNIPENKLKYYASQPYIWDGSTSTQTDGVIIPNPSAWTAVPIGAGAVIYTSGLKDTVNIPFGTLVTISFQLDPAGLTSGPYTATVTYTMSTTP